MNLSNALAIGYSARDIIRNLIQRFPDLQSKLEAASQAGYSAEEMVKYISKLKPKELEKLSKTSSRAGGNPLIAGQQAAERGGHLGEALTAASKQAAPLALGVGGGMLAARALRGLPQIAQNPLAQGLMNKLGLSHTQPGSAPQPMPGGQGVQVPQPNQMPNQQPMQQPVQQPMQPMQPQAAEEPRSQVEDPRKHFDIISQMDNIKNVLKTQNHLSNEDKARIADFIMTPGQKKWLSEQTKAPIEQVVSDYLSITPEVNEEQPVQEINKETIEQKLPEEKPQSSPIGNMAQLPDGSVGEIERVKDGIARINVDGRIRHVDANKIEQVPENVKESVIKLLEIPESRRSAVMAFFGYEPESQELAVQYHNGNLYTYQGVDPEKIHKIAEALGIPVTSGQNIFGKWEQGIQDSRGAALIQEIIKDPRFSRENRNKTWKKFETGYDFWEELREKPKPRKAKEPKPPKRKGVGAGKATHPGKKASRKSEEAEKEV